MVLLQWIDKCAQDERHSSIIVDGMTFDVHFCSHLNSIENLFLFSLILKKSTLSDNEIKHFYASYVTRTTTKDHDKNNSASTNGSSVYTYIDGHLEMVTLKIVMDNARTRNKNTICGIKSRFDY